MRVVTAPEIVYGARTAALAQAYYATQGVGANIWVSRSWSYSDELMGACMSSFEYMSRIGPNHDGNSFGRIGADMLTLSSMLRIPVDMHNVTDIFRPTLWDRLGGDDFRACDWLGPLYL